jgi:hypothetical protein
MFLRLEVHLGEHDMRTDHDCDPQCSPSLQIINVGFMAVHEQYNTNKMYHNDIALLRLAAPAVFVKGSYIIKVKTAVYSVCLIFR